MSDGLLTQATGYGISDTKNFTSFTKKTYELKPAQPRDVTIKIKYCGVCSSDVHTITGGWGEMSAPWICPGHEIIGEVTHVGSEVTEFKVGDRAGVGAQIWACRKCERCKSNNEQYCPQQVDTYNAPYPADSGCEGYMAQGGYSSAIRVDELFVFPIPEAIESEKAGPLLCAGLTVFSPLIRNGVGAGKTVGIVGLGGLGHLAVQFSKALGATVYVFSHQADKASDALRLGADKFISTADKSFGDAFGPGKVEFDYILSTADSNKAPIGEIVSFLKIEGKLTSVGLPDAPFEFMAQQFASNSACFGSSHIGSKKECLQMLDIAAKHNVRPVIDQILPMSEAGKAVQAVHDNKVRYRFVLKNDLE